MPKSPRARQPNDPNPRTTPDREQDLAAARRSRSDGDAEPLLPPDGIEDEDVDDGEEDEAWPAENPSASRK
jgi:hypothetical protein